VLDSLYVNGKLTLGENIADVGGLKIAFNAYKMSLSGKNKPEKIDGYTDEQRFFMGYAQVWRDNIREQELRRRIQEDVHSPAKQRVNGALFNIPEFYAAFPQIKEDNKLYIKPDNRPIIW
jgi:putative endopeptidase